MIRHYQSSDQRQLLALFDQAIQYHHTLRPDAFLEPNRKARSFLKDMIKKQHVMCLVYEDHSQLLGYLLASIRPVWEHPIIPNQLTIQLEEIFVLGSARRQGIATKLMQALHERAKELEADTIELMVWHPNAEALAFYRALGYTLRAHLLEQKL